MAHRRAKKYCLRVLAFLGRRTTRALAVVLPLAFGFLAVTEGATLLEMRFRAVGFLAGDWVFFREFNVPFMPAWAIDSAS